MTSSKDSEKHFPRLHIHILETQAKRWIENYPEAPVKRILLYSISFQLEGYMPDIIESYEPNPQIYAVVFEVDEVDKTLKMTKSELTEYENKCMCLDYDEKKFPEATYERLWFTTQPNLRRENFKNLPQEYLKLVTADFVNVYKLRPKDNYLEEWRFIVKFKNAELNADIRTDGPHVVLWEATPQADLTTIIEADDPELQKHNNVLRLLGNGDWYVKYNGKSDPINGLKGMRYIAFLLDNPDSKFDPLKILSLVGGLPERNEEYNNMSPDQLEKKGASLPELPIEKMTPEDKNNLEDTALKLWESSKSGNKIDIERWEDCKRFLDQEYGLFPYETKEKTELKFILKTRLRADAERERKNISRAISNAISHIKASNNDLAEFLSDSLHTGNYFCYKSDAKINWFVQM